MGFATGNSSVNKASAEAESRLPFTRGVINPNRGPGSVTRVITRQCGLLTPGSYRGVGEGASRATGAGLGRAGPHDLVLALAHLYVSKSPTGCLRPSARPEGSDGLSLNSLNGFSRKPVRFPSGLLTRGIFLSCHDERGQQPSVYWRSFNKRPKGCPEPM